MSVSPMNVGDGPPDIGRYLARAGSLPERGEPAGDGRAFAGLSDELIRYVLAMRGAFDLLRDAIAQLGGILVLAAGGSRAARAHPMLPLAQAGEQEARERLAALRVPAEARHRHLHLLRADEALRSALQAAAAWRLAGGVLSGATADAEIDAVYLPLVTSRQELQFACGGLPGVEIVASSEACACHLLARAPE